MIIIRTMNTGTLSRLVVCSLYDRPPRHPQGIIRATMRAVWLTLLIVSQKVSMMSPDNRLLQLHDKATHGLPEEALGEA